MKSLRTLILCLAPLGIATTVVAQDIPSPYKYVEETQLAGVFAGYLWTASVDPDIGPQPAPLFGVRYRVRFTGPISGQASLGFAPSERTVFNNIAPPTDSLVTLRAEGTTDMPLVFAEAGLHFALTGARTWNDLAPYILATGGVVADLQGEDDSFELEDDERFDFGTGFAAGVGIGTEWYLSRRLTLSAEIRDMIWQIDIPEGLRDPGQDDSRWTNNVGLSVGAALHF